MRKTSHFNHKLSSDFHRCAAVQNKFYTKESLYVSVWIITNILSTVSKPSLELYLFSSSLFLFLWFDFMWTDWISYDKFCQMKTLTSPSRWQCERPVCWERLRSYFIIFIPVEEERVSWWLLWWRCCCFLLHGLSVCSSVEQLSHVRHPVVKPGITGPVRYLTSYKPGLKTVTQLF